MKTFIINLEKDTERKRSVLNILSHYNQLELEIVNAIDGRVIPPNELQNRFDFIKFQDYYYRNPLPGEIGCTLSHQICYEKIINQKLNYAIIFEDDICIEHNLNNVLPIVENIMQSEEPRVLLLSGWFWYISQKSIDDKFKIAKVVDGYLTHSYAINYSAAKLLKSNNPFFLADAWKLFKSNGLSIYGLIPHPINQDWSNFNSTISSSSRGMNGNKIKYWLKIKRRTIIQHLLKLIGFFETK